MKEETAYSQWFVIVVAVFVSCLITANIISVKLVRVAGLALPAGILVFPLSYIVGDALSPSILFLWGNRDLKNAAGPAADRWAVPPCDPANPH